MRKISCGAALAASVLFGCVDADEPDVSDVELAATQTFYEKFDPLASTYLDGQNGWTSTGSVVVDGTLPNKYLRCVNGAGGWKSTQEYGGAGTYQMQFDYRPNVNVVNSTHGKLSLEGPDGRRVFQVIGGCDNIRVAYQMEGPVGFLRTFPCGSTGPNTWYRVVCRWSTGGTTLSCGASVLPADPAPGDFVNLGLPQAGLRPFDRVQVSTYDGLPGASLWDKIHMVRL